MKGKRKRKLKSKEKKKKKKSGYIPGFSDESDEIIAGENETSELEDDEEPDSKKDDFNESPSISLEVYEKTPSSAGLFLVGKKGSYVFTISYTRNMNVRHTLNKVINHLKEKSGAIKSTEELLTLRGEVTSERSRSLLSKYYIITPEGLRIPLSYFTPSGRPKKEERA